MTCTKVGNAYLCQPTRGRLSRSVGKCMGLCEGESRVVVSEGSPWYGPDWRCVDCGDSWCCEGLFPRPFKPRWRQEAKKRHEAMWERACECPVEYDSEHYALACPEHPEAV